jgi:hypothetical protein
MTAGRYRQPDRGRHCRVLSGRRPDPKHRRAPAKLDYKPMNRERIVQIFFFGLLALITYGLFRVLEPFLIPIAKHGESQLPDPPSIREHRWLFNLIRR